MPLVMTLGNPGLQDRHWEEISKIVHFSIRFDDSLTMKKIFDLKIDKYTNQFADISEAASKESALEKMMQKMENEWLNLEFTINPYKDSGTFVVAALDDIQIMLDDHIMKSMTMKSSPYIKPYEEQIR